VFFTKLKKPSTFLKYLASYVLLFTVLIAAFFLILRSQLTDVYGNQRNTRIQGQMEAACTHLRSEVLFLGQIDDLIARNGDITLAAYETDRKYVRATGAELLQYAKSSDLIDSIIYYSRQTDRMYSYVEYVTYADGVFTLTNAAGKRIRFDPTPYLDAKTGQLIWLDDGQTEYLFYFPPNASRSKSICFYVLDTKVIQSQLNSLLSEEVPAVALLDAQGNFVTGSGFEDYVPGMTVDAPAPGNRTLSDSHSLFLSDSVHSEFSLAAVVSEDYLTEQVDRSFVRAFFSLLGLSFLGIVLVYVAMLFTFRPLHRLVKSLTDDTNRHQNYLELISNNYSQLNEQKLRLEQTLAEYRETMAQHQPREAVPRDYPHEALGRLSSMLKEKQFAAARELMETMLDQSDHAPDYFYSCIILDCLTVITNSMSQACIEFEAYRSVFAEAVHQCRNIQHVQNIDTLKSLINELLFFYERETMDKLFHVTPLQQLVETNFCNPDFSIATIAEIYHVSPSRMSTLFKDEMGVSFTDYVWNMRLKKAQELLCTTDLSVEEISFLIGYLTSSSFGRKFKQATSMTPSQYRMQFVKE